MKEEEENPGITRVVLYRACLSRAHLLFLIASDDNYQPSNELLALLNTLPPEILLGVDALQTEMEQEDVKPNIKPEPIEAQLPGKYTSRLWYSIP